jgi:prepilin-type N-terminal cleavage/methylation domain-containing protein
MSIKNKGLTLIEVIIYIALFGILMTGVLTTAWQLLDGSSKLNTKTTIQNEGSFVLRKLDWALTGLDVTKTLPNGTGTCSQTLTVHKTDSVFEPTGIIIQLNSVTNALEIKEGSASAKPITTTNVTVSCFKFRTLSGTLGGISATTTINGVDFAITKYIRK